MLEDLTDDELRSLIAEVKADIDRMKTEVRSLREVITKDEDEEVDGGNDELAAVLQNNSKIEKSIIKDNDRLLHILQIKVDNAAAGKAAVEVDLACPCPCKYIKIAKEEIPEGLWKELQESENERMMQVQRLGKLKRREQHLQTICELLLRRVGSLQLLLATGSDKIEEHRSGIIPTLTQFPRRFSTFGEHHSR